MIKFCFSCLSEKDTKNKEIYPYPDDDITDEPISQLFVIPVDDPNQPGFRICLICFECFHKLRLINGPDQWMSRSEWEYLNPKINFDNLPKDNLKYPARWNPELYEINLV